MKEVITSRILRIILLMTAVCFVSLPAEAKYGGGRGTAENPYLIYTAEQMNAIGLHKEDWDKHFKLMADIDLSAYTGTSFNIIGIRYLDAFRGVFDGNGHTISNFIYINNTETDYDIGLFGFIDESNAEIKDLGLIDPNVNTTIELECCDFAIGSLVGYLRDGTISGCHTDGGSVLGFESIGGLIGANSHGTITNCCATGEVWGKDNVGGLVGKNNYSGKITGCYSLGSLIRPVSTDGGGLVGHNRGSITNCYSTGSVSAAGGEGDDLGGLVGANWGAITNCYSVGNVTEGATNITNVGGLVGRKSEYDSPSVMYCFWDTETSGQSTSAGGTGKTTAEMQMASTFISWGCDPVWTINRYDYPRLWWENRSGRNISARLSDFITGSGEPNDPYLIYTPEQLNKIGLFCREWDKNFKLMEDIDLADCTGTAFNIIGIDWDNPFTGVFDGNGHKISNFSYSSTDKDYIGLFGNVSGLIRDLGLIAPNIDAGTGDKVGSLVGHLNGGTIINCYAEDSSVTGTWWVGKLVGFDEGTMTNCYATGSVSGDNQVGGPVGVLTKK